MRKVVILSAPSGAGKTTLVKHLLQNDAKFGFSISACSRKMREGEVNGRDYFFLTPEQFRHKIEKNDFLEWEEVYHDHYYGTLKEEVERLFDLGKCVVFDVDVVGGLNLKEYFGHEALAIFVKPPDVQTLEQRLRNRATDSEEKIKIRVAKAIHELEYEDRFDYSLENKDLDTAKRELESVVEDFLSTED